MTVLKSAAMTVLAWTALGSFANAAPVSWFGSSTPSAWYANQSLANGGFYAPVNSPAPLFTNLAWFNSPAYLASLGSPSRPVPVPAPPPPAAAATPSVDAFINLGTGPYAESGTLTTGNPQPWYSSPAVVAAFGGTPSPAQQASFVQSVLADVQKTFQDSGINVSLTADPSVPAQHMLSVVSGATFPSNPNAIGITTVGGNGFSFINKLAYANSPDELSQAVAHNVAHELMHAFGVGSHPDATGEYLDAATANWSMLIDPNTRFSPEAVGSIQSALRGAGSGYGQIEGAQELVSAQVPEPATIAVWTLSALGAIGMIRRGGGRRAA